MSLPHGTAPLGAGRARSPTRRPRGRIAISARAGRKNRGPDAVRGGTLVDVARWSSTRVWLVASFLLVSAATAVAIAAYVIPSADQRFDDLERVDAVGSA